LGDRALAAAVKLLKRPTSSAWLVNLLVRKQPEQVVALLDLGAAMREAQAQLAGDELRRLSQQRRQAISALGHSARALARSVGQPVSEQARRELETTLEAALADPAAGDAVRSGRLITALRASGLGPPDLAGAVVSPRDKAAVAPRSSGTQVPRTNPRTNKKDGVQRRGQRREAAELALLETQAVATAARGEAAELAKRMGGARKEHRRLRQAVSDLTERLEHLRAEEAVVARQLREAEGAHEAADRSARAAERRADLARQRLGRLRD
jgi:hypothetical protein